MPHEEAVRPAGLGDLEAVTSLYVELKRHHAALQPDNPRYGVPDEHWRGVARRHLEGPDHAAYLALQGGRAVGLAVLHLAEKPWGTSCEIDTLIVEPDARARGHGTRLMDACERHARAAGARGLRVDVLEVNSQGREFYERRGYELFAVRYGKAVAGAAGESS
jgi:GNAT superfamily N-acetyltransferase